MAAFIDFTAPFKGAEAGRKENDRINTYQTNKVKGEAERMAYDQQMQDMQANRSATDYMSTFWKNQNDAVKAGISPDQFILDQRQAVFNDPNFQRMPLAAQSSVIKALTSKGQALAKDMYTAGDLDAANKLLANLGDHPAVNQFNMNMKAGNFQGAMESLSNILGRDVNANLTGNQILDMAALAMSNGDVSKAQLLAKNLKTQEDMSNLTLSQMQAMINSMTGQGASTTNAANPLNQPNAQVQNIQNGTPPQNGTGTNLPVGGFISKNPTPEEITNFLQTQSGGKDIATLFKEMFPNGASANVYSPTQPFGNNYAAAMAAAAGINPYTGQTNPSFIDPTVQENAVREKMAELMGSQYKQDYVSNLMDVINGRASPSTQEAQLLQEMANRISNGGQDPNEPLRQLLELSKSNPNILAGTGQEPIQNYFNNGGGNVSDLLIELMNNLQKYSK